MRELDWDLISEGFRFAQPFLLWGLLVLPLLWFWLGHRRDAPAIGYSTLADLKDLGRLRGTRGGWIGPFLLMLSLALMIAAVARPQSGRAFTTVRASGIDIFLVLDVSSSMLAEDFTIGGQRANRLAAVKEVTEDFIESRPNDRMGIVAFAGKPFLVSPLTLDHQFLLTSLNEQVEINFQVDGTAIGSAIASSANKLKDRESKSRIMVLLTDGTNNAGTVQPLTAAEAAEALGIKIYTIGAGTRGIAPFPRIGRDGRVQTDLFGNPVYGRIKVEFDEETLKKIAEMTGGRYYRATGTDSLKAIYDEIDQLEKSEVEVDQYEEVNELFWLFLLPGAVLLFLYLLLRDTLWRRLP